MAKHMRHLDSGVGTIPERPWTQPSSFGIKANTTKRPWWSNAPYRSLGVTWCSGVIILEMRKHTCNYLFLLIEESLRSQLTTIWTDGKEEKSRREKIRERVRRKKARQKVEKSWFTLFFHWFVICGSGGSKSRLAKAAGAEPSGQMRDEKLHAVVRSTFWSQNVQDHFWKLRCQKSARRCGAKHMSKSKCTKHLSVGPLLEVELSKKCTPLWRKAHFEVKSVENWRSRTAFGSWDVEKVHAVVARSTFPSQKCKKHRYGAFLDIFGRSDAVSCGRRKGLCTVSKVSKTWMFCSSFSYNHHYATLHHTTLH